MSSKNRVSRRDRVLSRLNVLRLAKKHPRKLQGMEAGSELDDLKAEVALLTSYSSDVVYKLRYDSMKYDYVSPSVTRLLGYSPDEMKRMNIRNLILETKIIGNEMKSVENFELLESERKSGTVSQWQADYLMKTKDGRRIWVSDISYPWFDTMTGAMIGSIGTLRDITRRVQASEQMREELTRIANTDVLTGIANRRVFFDQVEGEIKRIKRARNAFSILLIDVDYFKKINDSYGHDVGDAVLIGLGERIGASLREVDLAARLGGEEFGVVLPETDIDGAKLVAERIRDSVASTRFAKEENEGIPVSCTVSIGIASMQFNEEITAARLYKMADTQLYIAKKSGRNQVSVSVQNSILKEPVA